MKKRIWSILLALCMVLSLLPFGTVTASAADVSDLSYRIENDTVTITGCSQEASGALTIPATIEGYPVTSIGDHAFSQCSSLTSVTIPNGVTSISNDAFRDCSSLTSVNIPDSVTSIDVQAFFDCDSLASVTIPGSVTSIGAGSFSACKDLTAILVEESSPAYCSVDGVLLSKDQKTLVCYPAGKTGAYVIPDNVTVMEPAAFMECTGLTGVTIPNGVTVIDQHTFYGCTGLTSITIPEGVTGIFYMAFYGCENLRDVTFPLSLQNISFAAFAACGIKDIWYAGTEAQWHAIDSWAYDGDIDDYGFFGTGAAEHYNAHTHTDLTAVAAVAPTCTKDGTGAYWKCNTCGKLFSDVLGKYEIAAPAAVPAAGHKWDSGEVIKEPTETAEGVKTFTCTVCGEKRTEAIAKLTPKPVENPFTDVPADQYYYEPVLWAVNHDPQITNGTGDNTFSPDATCTRGQIVTFLWRAKGCPEPKSTVNPFTDVKESDYFYKAILWANENDVTNGTGDGTFSPEAPCTRAHVVTFLWRAEGKPAAGGSNPFRDVPAGQYYTEAVLWAVNHDPQITNGTGPDTFGPNDPCTRGQIVTFLYRDMK